MKILVLGGYGLIGLAITRGLLASGHDVTGVGRSARKGRALASQARWIEADMSRLTDASAWGKLLAGMDVVVNAAGVLQDGLSDRVVSVQRDAVVALVAACSETGVAQLIQISAPGVSEDSNTPFFRSKAQGDAAVRQGGVGWVILRPGLVLSSQAYGGTGLLRQLAAFPMVQPVMLSETPVQTVHVDDVVRAVCYAVENRLSGVEADLVEPEAASLGGLVVSIRTWLGFGAPGAIIRVPAFIGAIMARAGDLAGWFGWRPALRTTSLKVLASGVTGDGAAWKEASGLVPRSLAQSLRDLPSTLQERVFSRASLLFPVMLLTLSAFWIASGVIGWLQRDAAAALLEGRLPAEVAKGFVLSGSIADVLIGLGLLFRPTLRLAALSAIALSFAYIVGSALFAPYLWSDPLGPMVKVFPGMALALAVWGLAESR